MISKLVAWDGDRRSAIARMRRALDEYVVTGIRTTVPFFAWLLRQPDFLAGRFHTTSLDEMLAARGGRPFSEPGEAMEEMAAIAAAVQAVLSPAGGSGAAAPEAASARPGTWKAQARVEGLR
jgi:acetyl-CoA carboxylase biotin carboxylase subunit